MVYCNGCEVRNSLFSVIENGDSLNPGAITWGFCHSTSPWLQSSLILDRPRSVEQYYLFNLDLGIPYWNDTSVIGIAPEHLYFNVIDLSFNDGLGKVIEKNTIALQDTFGRCCITGVRQGNGRDWFVVAPKSHSNCYFILSADPEGVVPVDTICEGKIWGDIDLIGQATFSPDGQFYARNDGEQGLLLFSFDRCIGKLEFIDELELTPDTVVGAGVAFSPDSRFLYASKHLQLYQFDLHADDIQASQVLIGEWTPGLPDYVRNFNQLQLAPDGKIYIGSTGNFESLHIIHEPNRKGDSCRLELGGLRLSGTGYFGIPLFPNFRLGPLDGSPCDTLGINNDPEAFFRYAVDTTEETTVRFRNLSYHEPETYSWDFGDGTSSMESDPVHTFSAHGLYETCLTVSNTYGEDTFCRTIELLASSISGQAPSPLLYVYPNPAADRITVLVPDADIATVHIRITSAVGSVVYQGLHTVMDGRATLDVQQLIPGIYYCTAYGQHKIPGGAVISIVR